MAAGTITLTNNSDAVSGAGTAFLTDLAPGDFIVANVGGIAYTLPVKAVVSDTALTIINKFTGPTMNGLAWFVVTREQQSSITAALVAQSTEALRGLNYDKSNWQAVFSAAGEITVMLPDGTQFTGPSWISVTNLLKGALKREDIVGVVSQAAGLPTGAIIETGGNANGTYTRFADGTMICVFRSQSITTTSSVGGPIYASGFVTHPFPAAFSNLPKVSPASEQSSPGSIWSVVNSVTVAGVTLRAIAANGGEGCFMGYMAIGRWF